MWNLNAIPNAQATNDDALAFEKTRFPYLAELRLREQLKPAFGCIEKASHADLKVCRENSNWTIEIDSPSCTISFAGRGCATRCHLTQVCVAEKGKSNAILLAGEEPLAGELRNGLIKRCRDLIRQSASKWQTQLNSWAREDTDISEFPWEITEDTLRSDLRSTGAFQRSAIECPVMGNERLLLRNIESHWLPTKEDQVESYVAIQAWQSHRLYGGSTSSIDNTFGNPLVSSISAFIGYRQYEPAPPIWADYEHWRECWVTVDVPVLSEVKTIFSELERVRFAQIDGSWVDALYGKIMRIY